MSNDTTNNNTSGKAPRRRPPQHTNFWLKAQARTLSVRDIMNMSEAEAMKKFAELRWPETGGEPICPECGCIECYSISTRRKFKCSACYRQFSVTSFTMFHCRKLTYREILLVVLKFVNGAKGISSMQLARDVGINPKSAYVLLHKLREAIHDSRQDLQLGGTVEMDGAYYGGKVRHGNTGRDGKIEGKDAKPAGSTDEVQSPRKCVLALVQRGGSAVALVVSGENHQSALHAAERHIAPDSTIMADEHPSYDLLLAHYPMARINHRKSYWSPDASTNIVENFHGRMRRAEIGVYHRISGPYLDKYASEMALRHSRRTIDNGSTVSEVIEMAIRHPVSRTWSGYWRRRPEDRERRGPAL